MTSLLAVSGVLLLPFIDAGFSGEKRFLLRKFLGGVAVPAALLWDSSYDSDMVHL